MRRLVPLPLALALATGCVTSEAAPIRSGDPPTPTPVISASDPSETAAPAAPDATFGPSGEGPPAPDRRIPRRPGRLARALEETYVDNRAAIDAWTLQGDPSTWPPPGDVELLTLYEQRIVRVLASRPKLARRVLRRVPHRVGAESGANVAAGHALYEHFSPVRRVPEFRIRRPEPADVLLGSFQLAERRFGVAWQVLAAIMLVETRMGRIRSNSSAGAQGPMQFLPSTWDAYGLGGDVRDPHDAILGAANYLRASGAPRHYRRALHAYNPVDAYVKAVWGYAKNMMRRPSAYYAYYNWQVFVRTTHGDVRLSGPGL